jgi:CheY-like chemotaxis protein
MDTVALKSGFDFFKRLLKNHDEERRVEARLKTTAEARILVVDDSPTICAILGRILGQDGYAVSVAGDGESALEMAGREQPALIFLDIVLPGINGFAVLRALRHDPQTAHIPIVMISGNPQATEQLYVQRFGADDFVSKPFGYPEISRSIDRLVSSGRLAARAVEEAPASVLPESAFLIPQALRDKVA